MALHDLSVNNTSAYDQALNVIQPSALNVLTSVTFTGITALTDLTASQIRNRLLESLHTKAAPGILAFADFKKLAAFEELANRMSMGSLQQVAGRGMSSHTHKGVLQYLHFTNTPETINRHPLEGRTQMGKVNFWFQPYGQLMSQKGNNSSPGVRSGLGGFALGADYRVTPSTLIGILGGASTLSFDWMQNRGSGHMGSGFGGFYAGWKSDEGFYIDGQTIFGGNGIETQRTIQYASVNQTAKGKHRSFQFSANLEFGYNTALYDWCILQPFWMGDYMVMSENSYTETGAGTLNMNIKSKTTQFFQWNLGLRTFQTYIYNDVLLRPSVEIGWVQRRPSSNNKVVGGLINQPTSLVVTGTNKVYNQMAPGIGLFSLFPNGLYASGNIYAECGGGLNIGEILIRIGYDF